MDNNFSNPICYMFFICTILLNVLVVNSKTEISTGYFSDRNYTWKAAKDRCKMIGLLDKIQVPDSEGQLGWVDASVEYSPWVEYTNCFYVRPEFINKHKRVTYGDQLQQCMHYCEDYNYIGLQQSNCSCLSLSGISNNTVKSACNQKETCRGDKYAYCSYRANDSTSQNNFVVYKKVNVSRQFRIGNCLSVTISQGQKNFIANPCGTKFKPLCSDEQKRNGPCDTICDRNSTRQNLKPIYNDVPRNDWANSFNQCSSYGFVSYDMIKRSKNLKKGNFWLGILRSSIIHRSADAEPKYCIAVVIQNDDHQVFRYVRPCTNELPAVCAATDMSSSDNNILLIVLTITAVLLVAIIIAVIVLYKRRTSLRSGHRPSVVPNNEVTYAQVNKPTKEKTPDDSTRNNTADDTYDHMEHHRLSQNQIPTESNYDTMQSVGIEELENDYDVTSGTDRTKQIVVDDTAEYSHVEVEYQEIKDVPT